MPWCNHANPRTYGTKLRDCKREVARVYAETTRKFDVTHYNATGELKYLDEEEKDVTAADQKAKAQRMRDEITTIEQFDEIGSYRLVAERYCVSVMTAHALMRSLRAKKLREEKEMLERQVRPTLEEIEKFHTDLSLQELPKVEFSADVNLLSEAQKGTVEALDEVSEGVSKGWGVERGLYEPNKNESEFNSATFCKSCACRSVIHFGKDLCDACAAKLDEQFQAFIQGRGPIEVQVPTIEQMRESIKSDIAKLHKMEIAQAERNFQAWLAGVGEEC